MRLSDTEHGYYAAPLCPMRTAIKRSDATLELLYLVPLVLLTQRTCAQLIFQRTTDATGVQSTFPVGVGLPSSSFTLGFATSRLYATSRITFAMTDYAS